MGLDKLTETTLMKITYLDFYINAINSKLKDMSEVEKRTILKTQIEATDMMISKLRPLYEKYYVEKMGNLMNWMKKRFMLFYLETRARLTRSPSRKLIYSCRLARYL